MAKKELSWADEFNKKYGDQAKIVSMLSNEYEDVERVSSGSLSLDLALGGGLPRGRIVEIYGPESSGKTTVALTAVASVQKAGGTALFVDAEHSFSAKWACNLGVVPAKTSLIQPMSGEQALQAVNAAVSSASADIIVIDSVSALVPEAELRGEIGDTHMGLQARLMSNGIKMLLAKIANSNAVVIFINQIREKIGVMFGSPETTSGGRSLKFYASIRIDARRVNMIKDGERVVGQRVRCKIVKNKTAPPAAVAEFDMLFDGGISYEADIIDAGLATGVLTKAGAYIRFGELQLGQGKEKSRLYLVENSSVANDVRNAVLSAAIPSVSSDVVE